MFIQSENCRVSNETVPTELGCLGLRTEQDFLGKGHWEDGLLAAGKGFFDL